MCVCVLWLFGCMCGMLEAVQICEKDYMKYLDLVLCSTLGRYVYLNVWVKLPCAKVSPCCWKVSAWRTLSIIRCVRVVY